MLAQNNFKYEYRTEKDEDKLASVYNKTCKQCKHCGYKTTMINVDRIICRCGNYIYKNEQVEFKYKLKEALNKCKNN